MDKIDIIKHFERFDCHGNGLIIKGRVRSGKTHLVSIFTKLLLNRGFAIISNVRFTNEVLEAYGSRLFYISSDFDYFEAYLQIPPDTPIVLVWDDAQASEGFKSTHVGTKEGESLSKFLIFIGKLETNYIFIAHQKYIPNSITEGFDPLFCYKLKRNSFWLGEEFYFESSDIYRNCVNIPVPPATLIKPLNFLSKAPAKFKFRLDLDGLYNRLSQPDIGENLRKGVKDFLDKNRNADEYDNLKALTWRDIVTAIWLKRPSITGKEALYEVINPQTLYPTLKRLKKN